MSEAQQEQSKTDFEIDLEKLDQKILAFAKNHLDGDQLDAEYIRKTAAFARSQQEWAAIAMQRIESVFTPCECECDD